MLADNRYSITEIGLDLTLQKASDRALELIGEGLSQLLINGKMDHMTEFELEYGIIQREVTLS